MDKETLNNMPEYVKNLPQPVQDLVFDGTWEDRTAEIAKKYSLTDTQTDALTNNVLFVLIGLDTPDTFLGSMVSELSVSKLLADQIVKDLENRVFDYALKFVENKEKKNQTATGPANIEPTLTRKTENETSKTPEIKPENLPMVEPGEIAHDIPPLSALPKAVENNEKISVPKYMPSYKPVSAENKNDTSGSETKTETPIPEGASRITYKQTGSDQPIQRPVPVPRLKAVPIENTLAEKEEAAIEKDVKNAVSVKIPVPPTPIPTPQSMMDDKLKNPTVGTVEKSETPKPSHNYVADPYREPLQ